MNKLLSLLAAMSIVLSSNAQSGGKITGNIKDGGNQKIIDAASVSLLHAKDSSLVKVAVADKQGNFSFENVKEGDYLVQATSVGHAKVYSPLFAITPTSTSKELGTLQLVPADKALETVTVTGKKPFIERKIDKTIVNVEAAISNAGTTALEVLEKSPGVTVDKDGNVSLKGKSGVTILMDGKQTYLTGEDLANFLKNMPSSSLDQIEIITNPSAKYDASGTAGIINIKTKKNKQKGFNGSTSLSYGQGFYPKANGSVNLNYRNGKFNVFSTVSANRQKRFNDLYIHREYRTNGAVDNIFEQTALSNRTNRNYNGKIGVDFYATKNTTIGFVATGFDARNIEDGNNTTLFYNGMKQLDSIALSKSKNDGPWKNGSVNLNFRTQFDSTGRELTMDLDYVKYRSGRTMSLVNEYYTGAWGAKGGDHLVGDLPTDLNIYTAKADYTHPLKNGLKIETGVKTAFVRTENTAAYYNLIAGTKHVDYEKTNRFDYKENINAFYLNASKEIKKWGLQAGLRIENTNNSGHQFGNAQQPDSSFKNNYTGLFPNVFVNYNASDKNQFSFSYGRRIRRPDYEDLNPFLFYIDNYTYDRGNPFLQPSIANTFEVSHTYKQFLTTSVNYTHTKDLFTEYFESKGNAIVVSNKNYGFSDQANFSVSAQIKATKWWTTIPYAEVNYSSYKGQFNGGDVNIDIANFLVNVSNQFTFKNGWSAELSGFFRTKGIEGQIVVKPLGQMNGGVQKQILKKKGSLKLSVRDILRTGNPNGYINMQNIDARFTQKRDNRVATLTFSYRFGKPIKGIKTRKSGGAGDEQNRIKSGN